MTTGNVIFAVLKKYRWTGRLLTWFMGACNYSKTWKQQRNIINNLPYFIACSFCCFIQELGKAVKIMINEHCSGIYGATHKVLLHLLPAYQYAQTHSTSNCKIP